MLLKTLLTALERLGVAVIPLPCILGTSLMSGVLSQGAFRTCVIGAKVWRIVGPLLPLSDYYGGCKEFKLRPRLELI
jgi:hypothetical protein